MPWHRISPSTGPNDAAKVPARHLRVVIVLSVATRPGDRFLPERLTQIQPALILVDAESQGRDILELVVAATRDDRRPIVMPSDDPDPRRMRRAIAAGVSACVAAGTTAARPRPVLEGAMERFDHEEQLRRDLADARHQLEERQVVDRAKGWLMTRPGAQRAASSREAAQGVHGHGLAAGRGHTGAAQRLRCAGLRPAQHTNRATAAAKRHQSGTQTAHGGHRFGACKHRLRTRAEHPH